MTTQPFVLLDGGLSTALAEIGVDTSSELWTAWAAWKRPEDLVRAHHAFVEAGADVVTSASYQCDLELLERAGAEARTAREVLASTTSLARRATAGTSCSVAVSIGPFGASLADGSEYTGRYDVPLAVVERYHRRRLEVLVDTGADLFAVETIPRRDEARIVCDLLVEFGSPPAWFSFGVADSALTYGGDPIVESCRLVAEYPTLVAVGVNCTAPVHVATTLSAVRTIERPMVAYPNHGRAWNAVERRWEGDTETIDFEAVASWVAAGARYIGGCCGVGPRGIAHLARLRSRLAASGPMP